MSTIGNEFLNVGCCIATANESCSSFSHNGLFKFPAISPPSTVKYGAKATTTFALPPNSANYAKNNQRPNLELVSSRPGGTINFDNLNLSKRRGLIFLSTTLPFLFPLQEYVKNINVAAEEMGSPDYLFIKDEIRNVLSKAKAAGVVRLVFHDAGTFELSENSGGMNGSITYELDRPENQGLKKSVKVIKKAKNVVDERQSVSWADMIAVAGAEAVSICGGPEILVQLGRLDSLTPDPEGKLPEESLDAPKLKQCFQRKGFSTQELIALSGAHTLGNKGFGNPFVFDNSYYKILLEKPWLSSASGMSSMIGLPSDRALVEDDECLRWITTYANDQDMFFEDFKDVYIKLVNSGARWKAS